MNDIRFRFQDGLVVLQVLCFEPHDTNLRYGDIGSGETKWRDAKPEDLLAVGRFLYEAKPERLAD